MKRVKITSLNPDTGDIRSGTDTETGRTYDFNVLKRANSFSHLIPTTLEPYNAPDQPGGYVVRIKTCEISGAGHFVDIAGENAKDEVNNFIFSKLKPPEFWYMTIETARKYGCC